jgi:tetratricopeptide (TPR) repeat protein
MRSGRRWRWARLALGGLLLAVTAGLACVLQPSGPGTAVRERVPLETAEQMEARVASLEDARRRNPRSFRARMELGEAYYRLGRKLLDDEHDEARYVHYLGRANREFVAAAAIDPRQDGPHFWLAVGDAYRGDLQAALRGFNNTRKLHPSSPTPVTNIAEVYVYIGDVEKAVRWNDRGAAMGADPGALKFNDMLIAWRQGNLRVARRDFGRLRSLYPEQIDTINVARLAQPPRTFDEFAAYCCRSPACGPYMADSCQLLDLQVGVRDLSDEMILKELQIEIETKRRLQEIYDQQKELDIQVEPPR